MKIYDQEKKDGLTELILSKASVQFDTEIKPCLNIAKASAKNKSLDIFDLESVLVSVGWNSNDDVFDPVELWKARATPVNKKFNYMHNEKDIIGHITKAYVVDKDGNIIDDNTKEEDLPEFFEICVGSVMYSVWEDKTLQERANTLMAEIADGKWFVSMEVLFPDFDYAISKGSEHKIIERNENTSFLTKYLKIYRGAGEYQGWKIGRKLKDMFFSGKGLVDNPANKRSLITSFNGAKASTDIFNEVNMTVEQKDYDKAIAELGATKKDLESANKQSELLTEQVNSLKNDLDSSKAMIKDLQDSIKEVKELNTSKDEKITELNKTLAEMISLAKNKERVAQLIENGVDKAKAEEVVNKFAKASDEMFAEVVELHKVSKADKVSNETQKLEKTEANETTKEPVQVAESPLDETEQLLQASKAFILETLNKKENK